MGAKLVESAATLTTKTTFIRIGMESNWAWMTEMGNIFHAASNLGHT